MPASTDATRRLFVRSLAGAIAALPSCTVAVRRPTPWASVFDPSIVQQLIRRAADYQLTALRGAPPDPSWFRAVFYTGVLAAYYATGQRAYLNAAYRYAAAEGGWRIHGLGRNGGRHDANNHTIGQVYAELAMIYQDPTMVQDLGVAVDEMMAAPRPGREDWWWCDALFMAPPAWARLAALTGNAAYSTFLDQLYMDTTAYLYDRDNRLFFRDASYFTASTANGSPVFWSRGNGWVVAGLARILNAMPAAQPMQQFYVSLFRTMCERLAELQGADGLWRASLLDPAQFPDPETSGTAFFTFATAWGINRGVLDRAAFLPVVRNGWAGLVRFLSPDGRLGAVQPTAKEPAPVHPSDSTPFGVGAFLHAGLEILRCFGGHRTARRPPYEE